MSVFLIVVGRKSSLIDWLNHLAVHIRNCWLNNYYLIQRTFFEQMHNAFIYLYSSIRHRCLLSMEGGFDFKSFPITNENASINYLVKYPDDFRTLVASMKLKLLIVSGNLDSCNWNVWYFYFSRSIEKVLMPIGGTINKLSPISHKPYSGKFVWKYIFM